MDEKKSKLERRVQNRQERESQIAQQREHFRIRERNKKVFNYVMLGIVVVAVGVGVFEYYRAKYAPDQNDALAQCLTKQGVVMYGTDWCPHCQAQKQLFGESFKYVTFVNCDLNPQICNDTGVEGYPTWIFPQGPKAEGTQALAALAERADCSS